MASTNSVRPGNMASEADIIGAHGGLASLASLSRVIPAKLFMALEGIATLAERMFLNDLPAAHPLSHLRIVLTNSDFLTATAHWVEEDSVIVILPLGLAARVRVAYRLLIKYWDAPVFYYFQKSPLDNDPAEAAYIPVRVRPLLIDYAESQVFWTELERLDSSIPDRSEEASDVEAMTYMAVLYNLFHELAHVFYRHYDLLRLTGAEKSEFGGLTLRRGMEIQADVWAARSVIDYILGEARSLGLRDDEKEAHCGRAFTRLSFGIAAMFSIFDVQRKFIGAYFRDRYIHPLIRHALFVDTVGQWLGDVEPSLYPLWKHRELEAWVRCNSAFGHLNLELGHEARREVEENKIVLPIQSMLFSGTTAVNLVLDDEYAKALSLLENANSMVEDLLEVVDYDPSCKQKRSFKNWLMGIFKTFNESSKSR
jgi:hypothetical protein